MLVFSEIAQSLSPLGFPLNRAELEACLTRCPTKEKAERPIKVSSEEEEGDEKSPRVTNIYTKVLPVLT